MSDQSVTQQTPSALSSKERATLVALALSEAARRARFSTRRRNLTAGGFRTRRSDKLFSLLRILAFVGLVVLPTAVGTLYYSLIASDQYIAEARFTVWGGMPPTMDRLGAMTGAPSMLIIQDTQVIMNYLQSRALVESLDRTVGLQTVYGQHEIDWFSRLKSGRSIESVLKYWKAHIDLSVQLPAGIVVFTVRAFAPDDAVKLTDAALDASEQLVNRMNDQMRDDAVALAEKERQRAQDKLVVARATLERARNEEGILSADVAARSMSGLITQVKSERIKLQQQYESQRRFVESDAPQLQSLKARIVAADQEIAKLEDQITTTGGVNGKTRDDKTDERAADAREPRILSGSMSRLDEAALENTIAEKIYAGSLAALEHARLASETKLMYINTFVHPVAAEESKYPRRILFISLIAVVGLAAWGLCAGLLGLARNRLG